MNLNEIYRNVRLCFRGESLFEGGTEKVLAKNRRSFVVGKSPSAAGEELIFSGILEKIEIDSNIILEHKL